MSGFETRWLDLREPADHAARDPGLRRQVIDHLAEAGGDAQLVDIGCGTGSTFRALSPDATQWRWRLVDHDPLLLDEARMRHGGQARMEFSRIDLAALAPDILVDARLVTASALFDLVSERFIRDLAQRLGTIGAGLYAALNYDGHCAWEIPHEADAMVVAAFNGHQRGDKGFGPALGPDSGPVLSREFEAAGFSVFMAKSPWRLGSAQAKLQVRFIEGMVGAVAETGSIDASVLEDWRRSRLERIASSDCEVGHWDVLALR